MKTGEQLSYQADASGTAACVVRSGDSCGQLVVNLSLSGVISDPGNTARVGIIRMELVGSIERNGPQGGWAALDAGVSLGGSADFIGQLLDTMEEAGTTGV